MINKSNSNFIKKPWEKHLHWPFYLFFYHQHSDIAHNPEYKLDPSARKKDKVKESLVIGSIVTINKLIINGNNKKGHSYVIYFKGDDKYSNNYRSFIDEAIPMGELSFQ